MSVGRCDNQKWWTQKIVEEPKLDQPRWRRKPVPWLFSRPAAIIARREQAHKEAEVELAFF
jgi:hypothetical protein